MKPADAKRFAEVLETMPICVERYAASLLAREGADALKAALRDLAWFFKWMIERRLTVAPSPRLINLAEVYGLSPETIAGYPRHLTSLGTRFPDRKDIIRNLKNVQAFLGHLASPPPDATLAAADAESSVVSADDILPGAPEAASRPAKLGVAYIVFDGVELLESSIDQIRPHVDFLQVIYQDVSWFGHPAKPEDLAALKALAARGKIDELTPFPRFTPVRDKSRESILQAKTWERLKRQLGLLTALSRGCTHYLSMDVDEFYVGEEFQRAWDDIRRSGVALTAIRYQNYVKTPTLCRGLNPDWCVPFICKINEHATMGARYFINVDPTRGVYNGEFTRRIYPPDLIRMHHMETVRKDLYLKYDATTRYLFDRARTDDLIQLVNSASGEKGTFSLDGIIPASVAREELTVTENIFNIPYETWQ